MRLTKALRAALNDHRVELRSVTTRSSYERFSGGDTYVKLDPRSKDKESFALVNRYSGHVVAFLCEWTGGEWGAQRVAESVGSELLLSAHIFKTAPSLSELIRKVCS